MKRKSIFTCIEILAAIVFIAVFAMLFIPMVHAGGLSGYSVPFPINNPAINGDIRIKYETASPASGVLPKAGWVLTWLTLDGNGYPILNYRFNNGVEKQLRAAALYSDQITPAGDYQYLSAAQKVLATQTATTARTGLLSYTDWNTFNGITANSGVTKFSRYTITGGDVSTGYKDITTGLSAITMQNVQILRANVAQYNQTITVSAGTIRVAGSSGYTLTSGDVVNWLAGGSL